MSVCFQDKKILVIGGTGTIGSSLVKGLLQEKPEVIRVLSIEENQQFEMANEFDNNERLRFLYGDVRDFDRMVRAMEGIDYVFHTAALKQVPVCEYNPFEAVKTNIIGTQNVIEAAIQSGVSRVTFTSTDKTIAPTNTYGATKLVAERLISVADAYKAGHRTIFAAVRFGNVMGSRGSVIPLFKKQILHKRMITITEPTMTRFMMTLPQATDLTLTACRRAQGGEIFVLKMPVIKLQDLAEVVVEETCRLCGIRESEVEIRTIGLRPGEKMYEELMTLEESKKAVEFSDMFSVPPVFSEKRYEYDDAWPAPLKTYSSGDVEPIGKEQVREWLVEENLLQLCYR